MAKRNRQPAPALDDTVETTATIDELEPEQLPTSPEPDEADALAPLVPREPPPAAGTPAGIPGDPPCFPRTSIEHRPIAVVLPLAPEAETGYAGNHLDVRLDRPAAQFLARLRRGLNQSNVRLARGRHVQSANDAVRWLLEQLATAGAAEQS